MWLYVSSFRLCVCVCVCVYTYPVGTIGYKNYSQNREYFL